MLDRNYVLNQCQKSNDINEYLMSLYNIPVQMDAKVLVELGAGESTFALTAAANKTGGEFYSIDIGKGAIERFSPNKLSEVDNEPRFHFIQSDDLFAGKAWDKPIDFLFIDSDHTYDHVRQVLKIWPKWVKKRGIMTMHDTNHEAGDGMGCRQALEEWLAEPTTTDLWRAFHLLDTKILGMTILFKV